MFSGYYIVDTTSGPYFFLSLFHSAKALIGVGNSFKGKIMINYIKSECSKELLLKPFYFRCRRAYFWGNWVKNVGTYNFSLRKQNYFKIMTHT